MTEQRPGTQREEELTEVLFAIGIVALRLAKNLSILSQPESDVKTRNK